MVKEEEGVEDECSQLHVHGQARSPSRSFVEWTKKKKKEWRKKCSLSSFVGSAHILVQHLSTTRIFEIN